MESVSDAARPFHGGGPRPGPARPARAFTVIELLIVVTIIAIAASLVIPMVEKTGTTRLRAATRMLVADLEFAQIESMSHGDDPRLVVLEGAGGYRIAPRSAPATAITNGADGQAYRVTYGTGRAAELAGVTISAYALGGDLELGFGTYGQLDQDTPASITLAAAGHTVTVTVDPDTGEATVGPVE